MNSIIEAQETLKDEAFKILGEEAKKLISERKKSILKEWFNQPAGSRRTLTEMLYSEPLPIFTKDYIPRTNKI